MEELDLSLTVWAKTLTPQERADAEEPTPRTVEAWLRVIRAERDAGWIVLSPPDTDNQFHSPVITIDEIVKVLTESEGFTVFSYGFIDKKLIAGVDGIGDNPAWAVAMGGTELKELNPDEELDPEFVAMLRQSRRKQWYRNMVLLLDESGVCVGGWFNKRTGEYEINITLIFLSQEAAERFGLRYAQAAIFELRDSIEILIGGNGSTEWIQRW